MAVYRVNKNRSYTVMANYHLRDKKLSLKAVGLLSKMLSFNDGWQFSTKGLSMICKEGPDAVLAALRELEDADVYKRQPQTPKDEFRLRLFFSDCASANNRRQQLENRLAQHRQRLERREKDQDKVDGIPPQDDQAFNDYLVLLGGIFREQAACQWLETCLELCRQREE